MIDERLVPDGVLDDLPPILRRVLAGRGVATAAELDLGTSGLLPPSGLRGLEAAVERLVRAVREGERILFVGDFDADGATASALGVSLLQAMGAADVRFIVPNRFEFGYGLTPEIVALALREEPALIVTVDNGISSIEGAACAREAGLDLIVTDHHLPGKELPDALAIVNPNQVGCEFGSKNLAGVGVIWYLLAATRRRLAEQNWFAHRPQPNPADWLDLVALGTVADVVPLDFNNRVLVEQGLKRMRAGRLRPGLRALARVAGRVPERLTAQDLGFALGPRLNAAGRLEDMAIGIRCLLAETDAAAMQLATALNELNRARREIEQEMTAEAERAVVAIDIDPAERHGLCVYQPGWHQGVVGIVAGRVRERFNRPVIAFADVGGSAPDELKGSARSIPGLHVRDALADIAARVPGLILRFGGHAMAAGLTIRRRHFERFERAFESAVRARLEPGALAHRVLTDGSLDEADMTLDNAELLTGLGPWGQGFPEPVFHGRFEIVSSRVVGETHLKLVVRPLGGSAVFDAIKFRQAPLPGVSRVELVYHLSVNEWRDRRSLQLLVDELRPLDASVAVESV